MRLLRAAIALGFVSVVATAPGCGGGKGGYKGGMDASTGMDGPGGGMDAPPPPNDSGNPPPPTDSGKDVVGDTAPPPADTGGGPWNGTFSGPITCPGTGSYATNWANTCGTLRWDIKTGTDSEASSISLLPTLTTIASLTSIPQQSPYGSRVSPVETTIWALQNVNLIFARLEDDSDYHLGLSDGVNTMIAEVPYPGCVSGGPWSCFISRARAQVETNVGLSNLMLDMGHMQSFAVSLIGAGFWDTEHGQYLVAKNGIELHAVLAICFGVGCDPTKD
jgi:hypothetical protein